MPCLPVLIPLNKIGPVESIFTNIEITKYKGERAIKPNDEKNISNTLLDIKYVHGLTIMIIYFLLAS